MYNNNPLETMESFKYLGLEVPLNHRWNECVALLLAMGKRAYNAFENTCNHGEFKCRVLMKYLFNTWVSLMLLNEPRC